jgi:hypothetical protein
LGLFTHTVDSILPKPESGLTGTKHADFKESTMHIFEKIKAITVLFSKGRVRNEVRYICKFTTITTAGHGFFIRPISQLANKVAVVSRNQDNTVLTMVNHFCIASQRAGSPLAHKRVHPYITVAKNRTVSVTVLTTSRHRLF